MKKFLPILLVLALCLPAVANVTVSVAEGVAADQKAEISIAIDGGSVVRGIALKVTVTNGSIDATADLDVVMAGFNAYIDYYYSNSDFLGTDLGGDELLLPGSTQGAHALADPDAAGVLDLSTAKSVFSISLGALDNSGAQGGVGTGGQLATIALTIPDNESASVCIEADELRGGIVGDDLGTVTVDPTCATIAGPIVILDPCRDKIAAVLPAKLADYDTYKSYGKDPSCWCWKYNCRGDTNYDIQGTLTKYRVYTNDLNRMLGLTWKQKIENANVDPCSDVMRDSQGTLTKYRVYTNDLNELLKYWKKKDTELTPCPENIEP